MASIADCLKLADQLSDCSDQPLREAQALLAHCADLSLSYMYTWPEKPISDEQYTDYCRSVALRAKGYPAAYICRYKAFWSLTLAVEEGVLIPRPETELLVEQCLIKAQAGEGSLLDLGTGTGAIALAFASENPTWQVTAVDANPQAVSLAQKNAKALGIANVTVQYSDWFTALSGQRFDVIVANPPYIDASAEELSGDGVRYEPRSALVAADNGMSDIHHIVQAAKAYLLPNAYLLLEHGYDQGEACRRAFTKAGYTKLETIKDYASLDRISFAQY